MDDIDQTYRMLKKTPYIELENMLSKVNGGWNIDLFTFKPMFLESPWIVKMCEDNGWTFEEMAQAIKDNYNDF